MQFIRQPEPHELGLLHLYNGPSSAALTGEFTPTIAPSTTPAVAQTIFTNRFISLLLPTELRTVLHTSDEDYKPALIVNGAPLFTQLISSLRPVIRRSSESALTSTTSGKAVASISLRKNKSCGTAAPAAAFCQTNLFMLSLSHSPPKLI